MNSSPTIVADSVLGNRLAGALVGLTALSVVWSGTACADSGQTGQAGSASQIAQDQQDRKLALKAKAQLDADAKEEAALAEAIENTASFGISPAAQQAVLTGGPMPTVGMGGLVPNARALAAYIANTFPGVQAIGGVRSDPLPDHPSGHAIDIMIGSDMGLGDAINADVQGQAERFGVVYTLWRVANHFNHVHVTVS